MAGTIRFNIALLACGPILLLKIFKTAAARVASIADVLLARHAVYVGEKRLRDEPKRTSAKEATTRVHEWKIR